MQFSLKRFGWLFKKHTAEHYKYYLMAIGVLIGILSIIMSFFIAVAKEPLGTEIQSVIFSALLLATGTIFTSTIFAHLGEKRKAIAALTLPVSHFEKYLVGWIYSYILFQLVFIGCFYLVASIIVPIDDWQGQETQIMTLFKKRGAPEMAMTVFLLLHAATFFGSIFFEKWHFIKTAFIFIIVGELIITFNTTFIRSMVGEDLGQAGPFENIEFFKEGVYYLVRFPHDNELLLSTALVGTAVLIWAASYFKLKEKEV